jgi:hypothetical protein
MGFECAEVQYLIVAMREVKQFSIASKRAAGLLGGTELPALMTIFVSIAKIASLYLLTGILFTAPVNSSRFLAGSQSLCWK